MLMKVGLIWTFHNGAGGGGQEVDEIIAVVKEGEMPPAIFLFTHKEARLTAQENDDLLAGLFATIGFAGN